MRNQAEETDLVIEETVVIESDGSETTITVTEEVADAERPSGEAADSEDSPAGEPLSSSAAGETLQPSSGPSALSAQDEAIYTIRLLTAVAVGAVVEGSDQLVTRLKQYEEQLQEEQDGAGAGLAVVDEDEFDRLRYAVVGLIFDTQNVIGRSLMLTAKAAETTLDVTNAVTRPFRNFFLFRPFTKRVEQRFDQMAERGKDNLARWIDIGRQVEPEGRRLATMTYTEIVDEFIATLAENPELKQLVAQQSVSLAAGVRDEVRERTVTVDNVVEDIARRIFRRPPREDLPQPPPQVQRWAGISMDDYKALEREQLQDEQPADRTE